MKKKKNDKPVTWFPNVKKGKINYFPLMIFGGLILFVVVVAIACGPWATAWISYIHSLGG